MIKPINLWFIALTCSTLLLSFSINDMVPTEKAHPDRVLSTIAETEEKYTLNETIVLQKGPVLVTILVSEDLLEERYYVRKDTSWAEVAVSHGESIGAVSIRDASNQALKGNLVKMSQPDAYSLIQELTIGKYRVTREIEVLDNGLLYVTSRMDGQNEESLHSFSDRYAYSQDPDWSYAPSIGGFVPDAYYKAPLVMCQSNSLAFGLLPDLKKLSAEVLKRCNHFISLNLPAGHLLSAGFAPASMVAHSVYGENQLKTWQAGTNLENSYFILLAGEVEEKLAFRKAVRLFWKQFGRAEQAFAADQQAGNTETHQQKLMLWDDWRPVVWEQETPELWMNVPLPNMTLGGGVETLRWGPGPSVYLSSWFNSMRTAYGMALYARRTQHKDLLDLAGRTVNLVVNAPGLEGAFKCIAVPTQEKPGVVWGAGDGNGGSTGTGYLGYDMSWTAYWLLRWQEAGLPYNDGILERCRNLAHFFINRQEKDGFIPTHFDENGIVYEDLSRMVKAETGPVALFLLQLYKLDKQQAYLDAAKKALSFMDKSVIPSRQWYDYETFWSCSPRTIPYDELTGQWVANNLALSQTVEAYLLAAQILKDTSYLESGEALLDYLLLYQQCWTHPLIGGFDSKTALLGGFTTQNSDAEWSDARQSQIGNVLMAYYRETGKTEYLERGIAALRAQFPVSPYENVAHTGYGSKPSKPERVGHLEAVPPWYTYNRYPDKIRGVSSFHWGTGSGMAGIEMEEDFLRDAVVDVAAGRGVGVNGINISSCTIKKKKIYLDLNSPFKWNRKPVIVFHQVNKEDTYHLIINGKDNGVYSGRELEAGLAFEL